MIKILKYAFISQVKNNVFSMHMEIGSLMRQQVIHLIYISDVKGN